MFQTMMTRMRAYTDNPDPLAKIAGTIALVIASNQPFYPLYLHWIVGTAAWPAWLSLLTMPLFLAVPPLAKRNALAGRALMVLAGVINTVLCVKVLGVQTGVELFLLPCALIAAALFRPNERIITLPLLALPFIVYLLIDGLLGSPLKIYSDADYASIIRLHAVSVASLTALIGILFAGISPNASN